MEDVSEMCSVSAAATASSVTADELRRAAGGEEGRPRGYTRRPRTNNVASLIGTTSTAQRGQMSFQLHNEKSAQKHKATITCSGTITDTQSETGNHSLRSAPHLQRSYPAYPAVEYWPLASSCCCASSSAAALEPPSCRQGAWSSVILTVTTVGQKLHT